jgi:hypothetical protein
MDDPTSNSRAWLGGRCRALSRVRIGRILGRQAASYCLIVALSGCELLFGSPVQPKKPQLPLAIATAQPTPSPTPTISADNASVVAQKASEAAEKARIASAKAAAASQEAVQASAEASKAAMEAELAVKLSQGSSTGKHPRKTAKRAPNLSAAASSPSAGPTPTLEYKAIPTTAAISADVSSSTPPTTNLVSAANAAQDQSIQTEAARLIDQTSSSLKKIPREKLDAQDTERYDVATKLLKNARDSFTAQDFIAAHSLANKAAILIRPLLAAAADK